MIKALWFAIKLGLLVALVVWVADRPGFVKIEWLEYTFTVHVGLFLLAAMATILVAIFIYNIIRAFVTFPASYRRYRGIKDQEKGYEALTIGLSAVAAGDAKKAVRQARRATRYLKGDTGLPLLLEAQAARLEGREEDALESFAGLLEDKNAAFLGVRGLLQAALDAQKYDKALEVAQQALTLHPKQPWILRTAYDLEIRLRHWDGALETLKRAEKAKAIEAEKARRDRGAILIAQAEELEHAGDEDAALKLLAKAFKLDEGFVPAAVRLARLENKNGAHRKAVSVIRKSWKASPHPDLANIWNGLIKPGKAGEPLARMHWFEKLLAAKADTAQGQIAAGRVALEEKLWGEARTYFMRALELEPSAEIYRLLATLEEQAGQSKTAVQGWLEKADEAEPDHVWICSETGRIYDEWSPVALPHGSFNTIEWGLPDMVNRPAALGTAGETGGPVLDAPAELSRT